MGNMMPVSSHSSLACAQSVQFSFVLKIIVICLGFHHVHVKICEINSCKKFFPQALHFPSDLSPFFFCPSRPQDTVSSTQAI